MPSKPLARKGTPATGTHIIGDLSARVLSGSGWVLGLQAVDKGLGALQLLVLGHVLAPNDFGLFAVASLTLLAFDVLTRTGFDDALIQRRGNIDAYVHAAFWIQMIRGVILAALVFFTAPFVSSFFATPAVVPLIRTLAVVQLLSGFRSPGLVLLQRNLDFRAQSLCLAIAGILETATTVILAFELKSAWAIVFGAIVAEGSTVILSYLAHPYRPKFAFSIQKAHELVRFGVWLFLSGLVSYFAMQADKIVTGKLLSTEDLGVYVMAFSMATIFTGNVAQPLAKALKPAYAELQNDPERLSAVLEKSLAVFFALFFPAGLFLIATAHVAVPILLGDKWSDVIPILPILALGTLFRGVTGIRGAFFVGSGQPKMVFYIELVTAVVLVACIYPFFLVGGLQGIAWATTAAMTSSFLTVNKLILPLIRVRLFFIREVVPVFGCAVIMATAVYLESALLPVEWWSLVMISCSGVLTYVACFWLSVSKTAHLNVIKVIVSDRVKSLLT